MEIGGGDFCDGCAWPECAGAGLCIRPFVSPVALLGLPVTPLEAVQIPDEIAADPPKFVFLGVDLGGPDIHAEIQLATVSLTGVGESPVVAPACPAAAPLRSDDGAPFSSEASASPVSTGTPC